MFYPDFYIPIMVLSGIVYKTIIIILSNLKKQKKEIKSKVKARMLVHEIFSIKIQNDDQNDVIAFLVFMMNVSVQLQVIFNINMIYYVCSLLCGMRLELILKMFFTNWLISQVSSLLLNKWHICLFKQIFK